MKYILLSYDGGSQMIVEALGPETVIGMVADVLRGNYDNDSKVVKIEIGDVFDRGQWQVGQAGHALT